ncbi:MAG: TolB family protein, partial [Planctomycetota bacterium]
MASGGVTIVFDFWDIFGHEVVSMGRNGRNARLRTEDLPGSSVLLSVSPNGKRIVWLTLYYDGYDLFVTRSRRGRPRTPTWDIFGEPLTVAWSPDSKLLLFEHRDRETARSDVYRVDARGRRRRTLTLDLPGSASVPGPGTDIRFFADGRRAALLWEFPERRGVAVVAAKGDAPALRATASMSDGEASSLVPGPDGGVLFTWLPSGGELPDLYRLDGDAPALFAAAVRGFSVAGRHLAVLADGLTITGPDGTRTFSPLENVTGFRLSPSGDAVAVVGTKLYRVPIEGEPEEVLTGRALESVLELVFVPGSDDLVVLAEEEGDRRLFHVSREGGVREPAAGLTGIVGAAVEVSPTGDLVLFRLIGPGPGLGSHVAWSPADGTRRDLTAESGVPGIPGGSAFSPKTGDVLFTTTASDNMNK